MKYYIIVAIISAIGFFVTLDFLGPGGNVIFKIFLFFALGFVIYKQGFPWLEKETTTEKDTSVPASPNLASVPFNTGVDLNEADSIFSLLKDPTLFLNSYLISQFEILFNFYMPNNGYIYIEIEEENPRLLYKQIKEGIKWEDTSAPVNIIKLIKNHKDNILIENNVNSKSNIIPYYSGSNYSPGSIMAITTTLSEKQKLYWIFDAPANGFFNEEELKIPVQINFSTQYVITNLVKQKISAKQVLSQAKEIELVTSLNEAADQDTLITSFIEILSGSFEAHKLTIAMVESNNPNMARVIKSIGQLDSTKSGNRFNLEDGLCGKVIANNKAYLLEDIEKDGYFIPRFAANEQTNFGLRSFLAVPLSVDNAAVGMISLEHKSAKAYTKEHKILLQTQVEYFMKALSRFT